MRPVKAGIIILLGGILLLAGGCWDSVELPDRGYVLGSAVDKSLVEDKVMVTVEIANPAQLVGPQTGGGGGEAPASWVLHSTGWTVFEAIRNMTEQTSSKLYWAHNQVYIIGEDLAREGVAPYLEVFIRDPEPRLNAWVVIAKGATGRKILSIRHVEGIDTARIVEEMIMASQFNSNAVMVNLTEFTRNLLLEHQGAIAGRIELIDPGEPEGILEEEEADQQEPENHGEGGNNENGNQGGNGGRGGNSGDEPDTLDMKQNLTEGELLRYSGAAMFKGDKLVGWLDRKQTRGLNWVTGNVVGGVIVTTSPEEGQPRITVEIKEAGSKISTRIEGDKPVVQVEVTMDGNLGEHMGERQITADPGLVNQLEARTATTIRNEIEAALAIAQEHRTDIFNFGSEFNRQHYNWWVTAKEEWSDEYFPELLVEVDVTVNLRRHMGTRKPIVEHGHQ